MKNASFLRSLCAAVCLLVLFSGVLSAWLDNLISPYFEARFYYDLSGLPVSMGGRVMPVSSASADLLKIARGKSSFRDAEGRRVDSTQWIFRLNGNFDSFKGVPIFRTDNKDLQAMLGARGRYFSVDALDKNHDRLLSAAASGTGIYAEAASQILGAAEEYGLAGASFGFSYHDTTAQLFANEWYESVEAAREELSSAKAQGRKPESAKLSAASAHLKALKEAKEFERYKNRSLMRVIPAKGGWLTAVDVLLAQEQNPAERDILFLYAKILDDISLKNEADAKSHVSELKTKLRAAMPSGFEKVRFENFYNMLDPFFSGMILYAVSLALLLVCVFAKPRAAGLLFGAAAVFILFALLAHSFGIFARMYIQMRPPVTNLYSSIVFVGWGAAFGGFILSLKSRGAIYALGAAFAGAASLLVALNLPHSGDTMGMMAAVLNSNFWLTAHVVTIVVGYCGVFLAGFLCALRLLAYAVKRLEFTKENSEEFLKNVYIILNFALLFSFAGTMLGGIWADMSWGRFWGWDPKENGALMIILWTAAAIHCKRLHLVSTRKFLAMCVIGNIVAAWAWFGINMLGVGLHAYGFMSGGWFWFWCFTASQMIIALLSLIPAKKSAPQNLP